MVLIMNEEELFVDAEPMQNDLFEEQEGALEDFEYPSSDENDYFENEVEYYQSKGGLCMVSSEANKQQEASSAKTFQPKENRLEKYANRVNLEQLDFSDNTINRVMQNEKRQDNNRTRKKDKQDRSTAEKVLDERTTLLLYRLINKNKIYQVNGCVSTGKEANVYHAVTSQNKEVAIKIYKVATAGFRNREKYVNGEFRFRRGRYRNKMSQIIRTWAYKEYCNLNRMHTAGIKVPKPIHIDNNVLLMEFIGSEGTPAQKLKDVDLDEDRAREVYRELVVIMWKMYRKAKLVHADLSEFNLLYMDDEIFVIDVSQSVEHDHKESLVFLRTDCNNITNYFKKRQVATMTIEELYDFIINPAIDEANMEECLNRLASKCSERGELTAEEQFESAYKPKVLRNWEVPKLYPSTPRKRVGKSRIIADERGHLLPDIKVAKKGPWSGFASTWNLPKKIDKETAELLNDTARLKRFKKLAGPQNTSGNEENLEAPDNNNQTDAALEVVPYVPGDLTEPKQRPTSYDDLAKNRFNDQLREPPKGYPKYKEDFSRVSPEPEKSLSEQVEEVLASTNMVSGDDLDTKQTESKKNRILSPIINAISNFNLAKKLHKENLEHNPLPDTITDAIYRKLQMQRILDQDPGLSLKDENYAGGVGWKGYPGYGPTKCTKMKIYRPKTCAHPKKSFDIDDGDDRPRSSSQGSFDRKWRFIRQNKVNPIDLAICWDLSPANPEDEPKRPTHIDGSNGSQAPAVFSLVHTPKDVNDDIPRCDGVHGCGPIFDHGAKQAQEKDFIFDRPRTSVSKSSGSNSSGIEKKRAKSAYNLEKLDNEPKAKRPPGHHQSSPNLCTQHSCKKLGKRLCVACELKHLPSGAERKGASGNTKTEYKMAFKAGVPQKYVSRTCYKRIRVPRQKVPYRRLGYSIHSLAPPFSLQKDKRDDYPEHLRLATVYQHSYKPLCTRKRSLLQTVYK